MDVVDNSDREFKQHVVVVPQPIWPVTATNRRVSQSAHKRIGKERRKRKRAQITLGKAREALMKMLGEERSKKKKLNAPNQSSGLVNPARAEVEEKQRICRFLAMEARQLSPSYEEVVAVRSRPDGEWDLWCFCDSGCFCKRREAMINSWKKLSNCIVAGYAHFWSTYHGECTTEAEDPDRENAKGTDEKTKFSNQGYIDSCTNMVRQQLIDLGRFQDAERLEFQKHDLDVRDYLCLLSTVVADRTTEMNTCIHNAVSNTDQIRRKLKKRRSKHHYWKRHREIDFGGCGYGYRGLAGGRSSPLRFVTNIEDLEDEPTGMEVNKEPCERLWGGEEEDAQMEFQVVWSKDDAESEWG